MMRTVLLCLALLALSHVAVAPDPDPLLIYECCVTKSIPQSAGTEKDKGDCTAALCEAQVNAIKVYTDAGTLSTDAPTKAEAEELAAAEAQTANQVLLAAVKAKNNRFVEIGLRSQLNQNVKQARFLARNQLLAENPVVADINRHANGVIKYKFEGELAKADNAISENGKKVKKAFLAAMDAWKKKTCIRFEASADVAAVKLKLRTVGGGGTTSGGGAAATEVEIAAEEHVLGTATHELGHVIGLDHTFTRADRAQFIAFDATNCVTALTTYCKNSARGKLIAATWKPVCDEPTADMADLPNAMNDLPGPIKNHAIWGANYRTTADLKEECTFKACAVGFFKQFDNRRLRDKANYDIGSIMHYDFATVAPCIARKDPDPQPTRNPEGHGITPDDASAVNELYSCRNIKLKTSILAAWDYWIHPDWDVAALKKDIAAAVSGAWSDGTWKLKKVAAQTTLVDWGTIHTGADLVPVYGTPVTYCLDKSFFDVHC